MHQGSLVPRDKMLLCKFSTKQYCYNSYIQLYAIQAVSLKRHKGGGTTWDGWDPFFANSYTLKTCSAERSKVPNG